MIHENSEKCDGVIFDHDAKVLGLDHAGVWVNVALEGIMNYDASGHAAGLLNSAYPNQITYTLYKKDGAPISGKTAVAVSVADGKAAFGVTMEDD